MEQVQAPTPSVGRSWIGGKAPALVGVAPKSLFNDLTEAKAIRSALVAATGRITPLPVVHKRRIIGITQGKGVFSDQVRYLPLRHTYQFGYSSYDDMIAELSAGKSYQAFWGKTPTSTAVANNWYDLWPLAGTPGSGDYSGTANTARQFDDSTTGAIIHGGNKSPDTKHLLSLWANTTASTPHLMLVDRVLAYDSNAHTNTANQGMTNTLTAQRYIGSGESGLQIACVVDTVQGATATNLTQLQYTDDAGNTTQSMPTTPTVTFIPSAAASTTGLGARVIAPSVSGATVCWAPFLPLAQGDTGARLIDNYTTSSANTGTFSFVMVRPLADIPLTTAGVTSEIDQVFQISALERIYDGACLNFFSLQSATTGHTLYGALRVGWG